MNPDQDPSPNSLSATDHGLAMLPPEDDGSDEWLGCEALHPLTWLPMPAAAHLGA